MKRWVPPLIPRAQKTRTGKCLRRSFYNVTRLQGAQEFGIRAKRGYTGRKTTIHGSTIWVDCSVRWMSISPLLSFFSKTSRIIRIYLYSRTLLWGTYITDSLALNRHSLILRSFQCF